MGKVTRGLSRAAAGLALMFTLAACGSSQPDPATLQDRGALTVNGVGVNAFLWRGALDAIAFMPLASADPFGGVIMTEWYAPPGVADERMKVNVYILGRELRADGVRVSVFRQTQGRAGWEDAEVSPQTATELENVILTKARQLRLAARPSR
jgi:hypothetical protein